LKSEKIAVGQEHATAFPAVVGCSGRDTPAAQATVYFDRELAALRAFQVIAINECAAVLTGSRFGCFFERCRKSFVTHRLLLTINSQDSPDASVFTHITSRAGGRSKQRPYAHCWAQQAAPLRTLLGAASSAPTNTQAIDLLRSLAAREDERPDLNRQMVEFRKQKNSMHR